MVCAMCVTGNCFVRMAHAIPPTKNSRKGSLFIWRISSDLLSFFDSLVDCLVILWRMELTQILAERAGFEPALGVNLNTLSRRAT